MSVVRMKKLTLWGITSQQGELLRALQALECAEPIASPLPEDAGALDASAHAMVGEAGAKVAGQLAQADAALKVLQSVSPQKAGFLTLPRFVRHDQLDRLPDEKMLWEVICQINEMDAALSEANARRAQFRSEREQLAPWQNLTVAPDALRTGRSTRTWLGALKPSLAAQVRQELAEVAPLAVVDEIGRGREGVCWALTAHVSQYPLAEAKLQEYQAVPASLTVQDISPNERIARIDGALAELAQEAGFLTERLTKLAEHRTKIEQISDALRSQAAVSAVAEKSLHTRETFQTQAWVPVTRQKDVERAVRGVSPAVAIEWDDPAEDETPPTMLREPKFIEPFNAVTEMFSPVNYRADIDPNALMMPFFVNFFGMMVSDAGYGLVMALATFIALRVLKPQEGMRRMLGVLCIGGLATAFWGAMFGGWFSIPGIPALMFEPMKSPVPMLGLCYGVGILHLIAGLVMKAVLAVRNGDAGEAVWDCCTWILILLSVPVFLISTPVALAMMGAGMAGILLFAGRSNRNPLKRLLSGLGSLYGISSYISDVLSYSRLFAMGLATGVIGMVINTVAGMLLGNPIGFIFGIAVLVGGHIFNLAINTLGAYVHACRLQYIEFYGKFYTGGGRPIKPLEYTTKYVRVQVSETGETA